MEKIWTTALLPPSPEVMEMSSTALKIISYLHRSEKLKFTRGSIEDNCEVFFSVPISLSPKPSNNDEGYTNDQEYLEKASQNRPSSIIRNVECTGGMCNLNESVDMFDISSTSNKNYEDRLDIKPASNINSCSNLAGRSKKKKNTNRNITDYFKARKTNISSTTNKDITCSGSNFSINEMSAMQTKNSPQLKKKINRKNNIVEANKKNCQNSEKHLPHKCISHQFKNFRNVKKLNYQRVSSVIDFNDLPDGTLKQIKYFSDPFTLKKSFNVYSNSDSKEESRNKKILKNTELKDLSVLKTGQNSDYILKTNGDVARKELPALNDFNLHYLNQDNFQVVNKILFDKDLSEIGFTICYRAEFCLLNKPSTKDNCCPNGLLLCAKYMDDHRELIFISSDDFKEEKLKRMLLNVLGSLTRKICYEAQAFILFVLDNIVNDSKRVCYEWCILDPLVAVWLLDPDHLPSSFDGLLKCISFSKQLQKEENWLSECCTYLKYQSQSMEYLYSQLHQHNLWKVFLNLETKIIPILAVMETSSIEINVEILKKMSTILQEKLSSMETEAETLLGHTFSFRSPLQIRKVLYDELKLDQTIKITANSTTRKGRKSTSESILKMLGNVHPLPHLILEYRQLWKLKSSYIDIIIQHTAMKQCVCATWELCAAATGRITSSSPNLQAMPKRPFTIKIEGKKIEFNLRSCFVARKGYIFVAVDFQQIELRIFAHLAKDKILSDLLNNQDDIFSWMTQVRLKNEVITKEDRDQTKTLVYAIMYGAGSKKLASILSIEESKVEDIKNSLFEILPCLHTFRKKILSVVRKSKVLKSLSGRRRIFPNISSNNLTLRSSTERKAINFIIQGSAADICKFTMLNIEMKLKDKEVNGRLMLQIHDELLWEVEDTSYQTMLSVVNEVMEENKFYWNKEFNIAIPLPVVITSGYNWGNMSVRHEDHLYRSTYPREGKKQKSHDRKK